MLLLLWQQTSCSCSPIVCIYFSEKTQLPDLRAHPLSESFRHRQKTIWEYHPYDKSRPTTWLTGTDWHGRAPYSILTLDPALVTLRIDVKVSATFHVADKAVSRAMRCGDDSIFDFGGNTKTCKLKQVWIWDGKIRSRPMSLVIQHVDLETWFFFSGKTRGGRTLRSRQKTNPTLEWWILRTHSRWDLLRHKFTLRVPLALCSPVG